MGGAGGGNWRRNDQMVAALAKQEARVAGKVLTAFTEAWGSSRRCRFVEGRTGAGLIARRSSCWRRAALVLVGGDAADRPKARQEHGQMQEDVASVGA